MARVPFIHESDLKEGRLSPSITRWIVLVIVAVLFGCVFLPRLAGALACPGIPILRTGVPRGTTGHHTVLPIYEGQSIVSVIDERDSSILLGGGVISGIDISPDDRYLAVASANVIQVFDAHTFVEVRSMRTTSQVQNIVFSPEGESVVIGRVDGDVTILDAMTGETLAELRGNDSPIKQLAWSNDGSRLAAVSTNPREILIWHVQSENTRQVIHAADSRRVGSVAWSHDNNQILTAWENDITLWDVERGTEVRTFSSRRIGSIDAVYWLPDSSALALAGANLIVFVDAYSGEELGELEVDIAASIAHLDLSQDGSQLAASAIMTGFAQDGAVINSYRTYLWDCSLDDSCQGTPSYTFADTGRVLAFDNSGRHLYSSSNAQVVRIDTETGEEVSVLTEYNNPATSLAFSNDNSFLAVGDADGTVTIWDLGRRQILQTLDGHQDEVSGLAWSPTNDLLASISRADKRLVVWDVSRGERLYEVYGHSGTLDHPNGMVRVAFSQDGSLISTTDFNQDTLWHAEDGEKLCQVPARQLLLSVRWQSSNTIEIPDRIVDTGSEPRFAVRSNDASLIAVALENGTIQLVSASP